MSAPDIFLSYNREDAARARQFAEAFAAEGLDVWWDVALRSGEAYDEVTEAALRNAKAVVVLWSPRSVVSRWVRAEATLADRNKTLMPAMIEPCERPIMFELVQTAELSHWRGNASDKAWQDFARHVREFIGKQALAPAVDAGLARMAREARQSVLVLPFVNMSGDPEQEYFADGITEDIITDLSKVSALSVISRNSAFTFKGQHVDIVEVATRLNVDHVLEGSVRKAGNRVRVTAQLIDGMNNDHVWAERFDRDLHDIFTLQDELSQEIVKALKIKLVPAEQQAIGARGTDNLQAYDFYLRGRGLYNSLIPEANHRSAEAFRSAVQLDPRFALAWAGLNEALIQEHIYAKGGREAIEEQIDEAFRAAVSLAPDLPEINIIRAQGAMRERDWPSLETCLAHHTGAQEEGFGFVNLALLALGRANEAAENQLELRRRDPLSTGVSFQLQVILDAAGRPEEAEAEYQRSLELQGAKIMVTWRAILRSMVWQDHERARRLYAEEWHDKTAYQPYREELLQHFDDPESAVAALRARLDAPACQDGARMVGIAAWASYFGDHDLALEAIRRGMVELRGFLVGEIWLPIFAETRKDARFKDILRDLGLAEHWRTSGNWGDYARPLGEDEFEVIA